MKLKLNYRLVTNLCIILCIILCILPFLSEFLNFYTFFNSNLGNILKEGLHKSAEKVNYPIETKHLPYDFTINYNLSQFNYGKSLDTTPLYENKIMSNNDFKHKRATYIEIQPHLSMINPEYKYTSTCLNKN